jgi:transcriptional regulator with XRE-family HTH domain
MFPNLKLQIFRRGSHQNQLAKAVGIDETVLSKIIHGYRDPSPNQRKILAKYLEAEEAWLFERFEVPAPSKKREEVRTDEITKPDNDAKA